jgi:hypothetical protein
VTVKLTELSMAHGNKKFAIRVSAKVHDASHAPPMPALMTH